MARLLEEKLGGQTHTALAIETEDGVKFPMSRGALKRSWHNTGRQRRKHSAIVFNHAGGAPDPADETAGA